MAKNGKSNRAKQRRDQLKAPASSESPAVAARTSKPVKAGTVCFKITAKERKFAELKGLANDLQKDGSPTIRTGGRLRLVVNEKLLELRKQLEKYGYFEGPAPERSMLASVRAADEQRRRQPARHHRASVPTPQTTY